MIAINGPLQGKYYHDGVTANKLIDHAVVDFIPFELVYYRSKIGWRFHSWKALMPFYLSGRKNERKTKVHN